MTMKRIATFIGTALLLGLTISGCAGNRDAIAKASLTTREDVFQQAQSTEPATGGALLKVEFPVKANKSSFITTYYKYENPPFTITVNIDGQATVVTAEPILEKLAGDFKENPEAGTGWKYTFNKSLVLQPGKHHVTVAVPLADVIIERDIDLKAGENFLKLTPVYSASVSKYSRYPHFNKGLKGIAAKLNAQEL